MKEEQVRNNEGRAEEGKRGKVEGIKEKKKEERGKIDRQLKRQT